MSAVFALGQIGPEIDPPSVRARADEHLAIRYIDRV